MLPDCPTAWLSNCVAAQVMDIARVNNIKRIQRCCTIMGRKEEDEMTAAQIFYPCMQCADVFFLKVLFATAVVVAGDLRRSHRVHEAQELIAPAARPAVTDGERGARTGIDTADGVIDQVIVGIDCGVKWANLTKRGRYRRVGRGIGRLRRG